MAEKNLSDAGMIYEKVYAEDNSDLCRDLGLTRAPTLVLVKGGAVKKLDNIADIVAFCKNQ